MSTARTAHTAGTYRYHSILDGEGFNYSTRWEPQDPAKNAALVKSTSLRNQVWLRAPLISAMFPALRHLEYPIGGETR